MFKNPGTSSNRLSRGWLRAVTFGFALLLLPTLARPAGAVIYTYENTTSGTIPEVSTAACNGSGLARTFVVSDSFTVSTIALGINLSHPQRGEVRAVLFAPNGTSTAFLVGSTTPGADFDDNYDIHLSANNDGAGTPPLDDGSTDPVGEPYYPRLVNFAGANFYTGNAAGTWTLRVCDILIDGNAGTTLNRAKLTLDDGQPAENICTTTVDLEWGDNGDENAFTSAVIDDVTLSLSGTRDLTNDGANSGRNNFTTQTEVFGGQAGYYVMQFDGDDVGDTETVLLETTWTFDPPVRYETWEHLDIDNGSWEDYVRVLAFNQSGVRVPYQIVLGTAHEQAGDILESDIGNVIDTDTAGNASYIFTEPIATLVVQYMMGDDFTNPAQQRIGIGNPTFCAYDYGDAPSTYGSALSSGPRHVLGYRTLYLGANPPDGEQDGQPGAAATGDDTNTVGGVDDEDGVASFPTCSVSTYTVQVTATNASGATGYLVGYLDWNRDGDFLDAGERSATVAVATGTSGASQNVTWSSVPANCGGTAATYARFRFTTSQTRAESPIDGVGLRAPDGEVEDYQIPANTLPVTLAHVASERRGGELRLSFATATENANAGFRVWGLDAGGRRTLLAEVPSAGPDSFVPQRYELRLEAAGVAAVEIEDLSLYGKSRLHGPFRVGSEVGRPPQAATVDWAAARLAAGIDDGTAAARAASRARSVSGAARQAASTGVGVLRVREAGVQRVTYDELLAAGVDLAGVDPRRLAIVDRGAGVPRYVEAPGGVFGPGGYIELVVEPRLTLASPYDAMVIALDRRLAIAAAPLTVPPGAPGETAATDVHRADHVYSPASPTADPWFDEGLLAFGAPATAGRAFDLPGLAGGPVSLDVQLWGYGDKPGTSPPDHHVVVRLNGADVAEGWFDGVTPWSASIDAAGLVQESGNLLELVVPGDTGYDFDYVAFEGFEVSYRRRTQAREGRFAGVGEVVAAGSRGLRRQGGEAFAVDGFAPGAAVAVWTATRTGSYRSLQPAAGGAVSAPAGYPVFAAAESAMHHPEVVPGVAAARPSSSAEYVIVTHPAFLGEVDDLVDLQESRGLTAEVVTVDEIYAAYSDHAPSADAIRSFFTASQAEGALRYALLVGADSVDPYDHLGIGSVSYVPTHYGPYTPLISFSPTDEVLVDGDGDGVADVPVGRLPVRTPAELAAVVDKLWQWEERTAASRRALLVAGASDAAGSLTTVNEQFAASLSGWIAELAPVDEAGSAAVRARVLAAINSGTPLISFVGHSSMGQWDFTPLLTWQDAATRSNHGAPSFLAQWGCWNAYYVEPTVESLSSRFLLAEDVGAAGAIGATTLTTEASHQALGSLFFAHATGGAGTIGDALLAAKRDLAGLSVAQDAILGIALLGDPAAPLPSPPGPPGPPGPPAAGPK